MPGVTNAIAVIVKSIAAATGINAVVVAAAGRLLAGVAINALVGRARSRGGLGQQDIRAQLSAYNELVRVRYVYGRCFATGTPLPATTKDGVQYLCCLLNSRPSQGNFSLYLDNRPVALSGDPYDLSGPGAIATNGLFDGQVTVWFGTGDQTHPPTTFTDEVPYHADDRPLGYKVTEAGRGLTIVWLKLRRGGSDRLQQRWPSYPRVGVSVLGDWSKVWDPRDPAQGATDVATHTFSRNQALAKMDVIMRNPFRVYSEADIDAETWKNGADVCDEEIALKDGGTAPRYRIAGTVVFEGAELEQIVEPVEAAGASRIARVGGKIAYIPGVAKTPAAVIADMEGLPSLSMVSPPEEQFDEVHTTYSPLERDGEPASLKRWPIPGVTRSGLPRVMSLDLSMVSDAPQAMRIRKIMGLRTTYTRRLEGVSFAEALPLMPGSWATTALDYEQMNGTFEAEGMHPLAHPVGEDGGVAMRIPISLRETNDAIYTWTPEDDEEDVTHPPFDVGDYIPPPPGEITITTGDAVNLDLGAGVTPRAKFAFDPPPGNVEAFEWQFAPEGEPYDATFLIDPNVRDGADQAFGYMTGAAGVAHNLRVRAIYLNGTSDWVETTDVTPVVNIALDLPTMGAPSEISPGTVRVPVTVPNDPDVLGVELFAGPDSDSANAAIVGFTVFASQNTTVDIEESGLGSAVTRFYFARSRGAFSSASAFTAGQSITTA